MKKLSTVQIYITNCTLQKKAIIEYCLDNWCTRFTNATNYQMFKYKLLIVYS